MDLHFATSVLLMVLMLFFVLYASGDEKSFLDRIAREIVKEHNSTRVLLGIMWLSFAGFLLALATLAFLVLQVNIYEAGHVWKNLGMAALDVVMAFLTGWFLRLWDHALKKREWYVAVAGSPRLNKSTSDGTAFSFETVVRNGLRFILSAAITGIFPGIVMSKPSMEIAKRISDLFNRSSLLLFAISSVSIAASFVVGFWGSLFVFAYASQVIEPWELASVWFAWAGVSIISLIAFEIARSSFRKGRERMSEYIGETFDW